jgi:hypothetical protein
MQSHIDDQACECRCCGQPMKLIRRLPKMGPAPEFLVFYCRDCNEVDSASWRPIPPAQCVALH